jgi:hypothetical protein
MFNLNQRSRMMKHTVKHSLLCVSLMSLGGLGLAGPSFAAESGLPAKPQAQSEASQSVQPKVDKLTAEAVAVKRKTLVAEAAAALAETHKALKALENVIPSWHRPLWKWKS